VVGGPHARTTVVGTKAIPSRLSATHHQPRQVIGSDSLIISRLAPTIRISHIRAVGRDLRLASDSLQQ